jgi:anthranilate phosphoribosyltransferase
MEISKIRLLAGMIAGENFGAEDLMRFRALFTDEDRRFLEKSARSRSVLVRAFNATRVRTRRRTPFRNLIQIGGTGGDTIKTVNVSTLSAMVLASIGHKVVKTGSRAVSGFFGSSDFIFALRDKKLISDTVLSRPEESLRKYNFCYVHSADIYPWLNDLEDIKDFFGPGLFAKLFSEMDRNEIGAKIKIDGIADADTRRRAEHYARYGYRKILVVHGGSNERERSLDEVSNTGPTRMSYKLDRRIVTKTIWPSDFRERGLITADEISLHDAAAAYGLNLRILAGEDCGPFTDLVAVNVALYKSFADGFRTGLDKVYVQVRRHMRAGKVRRHFIA